MFKFSFEVSSCINKTLLPVINNTERGEKTLDIWTVRSPVLDPKWRLVRRGSSPRFLTREDLLILRCQTSSKHWNSQNYPFITWTSWARPPNQASWGPWLGGPLPSWELPKPDNIFGICLLKSEKRGHLFGEALTNPQLLLSSRFLHSFDDTVQNGKENTRKERWSPLQCLKS